MSDQPLAAGTGETPQAHDDTGAIPVAHPLQFDERGFPVPQAREGGFAERIRRLLAISP